jgi:purine-binding chemotaxis protein CheW
MSYVKSFLRFRLGQEWYGINVDNVIEVLYFMALTDLPNPSPGVLGMMRLRETIAPVTDLRLRFSLPATYSLNTPIIVAKTPSGVIGLVVDDVDNLEHIDPAQIIPHDGSASRYVTDVARFSNFLLLLLDVSLLRLEIPQL